VIISTVVYKHLAPDGAKPSWTAGAVVTPWTLYVLYLGALLPDGFKLALAH
jgi:hypothetical protein